MSGYSHLYWTCPFYRSDQKGKIYCEGGTIRLRNPEDLNYYAKKYCASRNWKKCSLAYEINLSYEEEYENEE